MSSSSLSADAPLRTDTLAGSVFILLALTVIQRAIGLVRAVLFCRWLDPDQLGQWDLAFGFLMLAGPLSVLALSGSFGRYVESYRRQGQFRVMLRRTAVFCGVAGVLAWCLLRALAPQFAELVFGSAVQVRLVGLLAGTLVSVIAFNYCVEMLTGLRSARALAVVQLVNGVAFAGISLALLGSWECSSAAVIAAYGLACLGSVGVAATVLRRAWLAAPESAEVLSRRALWAKLLPFAAWVWLTSMLANLFELADRYLLLHFAGLSPQQALAEVGNYHSSRVVPLLLVSIAAMLASVATPHLTHDWEAGRHSQVADRLNLLLKLIGFSTFSAAVAVLGLAPFLFGTALAGKFSGGLAVLPWTLTYSVWSGMWMVSQNWLWCREKAYLSSVALAAGLALNVSVNLVLLPRLGLQGAVLGTTAANLLVLVLIQLFNLRLGFRLHRGTWLVFALPPAIALGFWPALAAWLAAMLIAVRTHWFLSAEEKSSLLAGLQRFRTRLGGAQPLGWSRIGNRGQ